VEQELTPAEAKELAPYCQCNVCLMWRINPVKYLACPHCFGCIKSGRYKQWVIDRTIAYKKKRDNSSWKYFW